MTETEVGNDFKARARKVRWGRILILITAVLAVTFLIVRPGVIGFGVVDDNNLTNDSQVNQQDNVKALNSFSKQELIVELEKLKTNISSQELFSGALIAQIDDTNKELTDCKVENERMSGKQEQLQKDLQEKDAEISTVEQEKQKAIDLKVQELTTSLAGEKDVCVQSLAAKDAETVLLQEEFDEFVKNMAKSVCCKAKVDNPNIAAYEVSGNKLVCGESGENALSC
ncbi:hypothetical protein HYX13_02450 [Candidatus Woesearchaeota archaeon]|nr:hypothetical protein [Candidatus Woesearchaeota archaeon]